MLWTLVRWSPIAMLSPSIRTSPARPLSLQARICVPWNFEPPWIFTAPVTAMSMEGSRAGNPELLIARNLEPLDRRNCPPRITT
jgi:hypothetical protein